MPIYRSPVTNGLIKEPSEHSHVPDTDRLHVIRLKNEIKVRGAASDEGASTILFDVLRSTPLTAASCLPTNEALLQIIRRERPAQQLDHQGCLPPILRQTDRGENFILYEDNSIAIFTCDKNLSVLNQCKHWFMDGKVPVMQNWSEFFFSFVYIWFDRASKGDHEYIPFISIRPLFGRENFKKLEMTEK